MVHSVMILPFMVGSKFKPMLFSSKFQKGTINIGLAFFKVFDGNFGLILRLVSLICKLFNLYIFLNKIKAQSNLR